MNKPVFVESLVQEDRAGGVSRVSANVGGEPLWFESADTKLRLSPEGFGSALLVPAMSHGRDLIFEDPLCPVWLANTRKLMELFSEWFGWNPIKIESTSSCRNPPVSDLPGKRYLCFSGGVDSFYSLLTYPEKIDALMMVHGYDIRLDDEDGARIAFEHVRQVAVEMNLDAVMVRTNYREHSVAGKKYKYAYGGALACAGHLLFCADELIISSGSQYDETPINGSHWMFDSLWSSKAVKITPYGAHLTRGSKLLKISENPVVRRHLHVCQENLTGVFELSGKFMNCGRCQKCIRTLLVLHQAGDISDLETFENKGNLDEFLGKTMQIDVHLFDAYHEICRRGVDEKTERSIRALIRRSKVLNRMGWAGRRGRKMVFRIFRQVDAVERKIRCRI